MIMKTFKKIALAGVFVSLIACEKDFLDIPNKCVVSGASE